MIFQGPKGYTAQMCEVHLQYGNSTTKWPFYTFFRVNSTLCKIYFLWPSSIFHLPSSIFHLPSSIFRLSSFIFHYPSSIFHLQSPIFHYTYSISHIIHLPSTIFHYSSCIFHYRKIYREKFSEQNHQIECCLYFSQKLQHTLGVPCTFFGNYHQRE